MSTQTALKKKEDNLAVQTQIIDVAASFYCGNQTAAYNQAYRKWRCDLKNPYGFRFVKNLKEHAYVNGRGFVETSVSQAEHNSLVKNMGAIGLAVLVGTLCEVIFRIILIFCLNLAGITAHFDLIAGLSTSNEVAYVLVESIAQLSLRVISLLVLFRQVRLPAAIWLSSEKKKVGMSRMTVSGVLGIFVVAICASFLMGRVLSVVHLEADSSFFCYPTNPLMFIIYMAVVVFLVPIVSELFLHGMVMQLLRQFGEGFALLTAAVVSAVATRALYEGMVAFLAAMVIGWFVLSTGSVRTGIMMRVALRVLMFAYTFFPRLLGETAGGIAQISMLFLCGTGALLFSWIGIRHGGGLEDFRMNQTFLSLKAKMSCALTSTPFLIWLGFCIFMQILSLSLS